MGRRRGHRGRERVRIPDHVVGRQHQQLRLAVAREREVCARATAAAVPRPAGSSAMHASATPASRHCSAARKRCASATITTGGASAMLVGANQMTAGGPGITV